MQKFANTNNKFQREEDSKRPSSHLLRFTDEHDLLWSIKLRDETLYVELPEKLDKESKEKFVCLLEFAEETLHCQHVIVFFNKSRSDRASLVKTFMFLGFHLLSPDNTLMKADEKEEDQLYLVYLIDN